MPSFVPVRIGARISVEKRGLAAACLMAIRQSWTLPNPLYDHHGGMVAREGEERERAAKEDRPFRSRLIYVAPPEEFVRAFWETEDLIEVPRGCGTATLLDILRGFGHDPVVEDVRVRGAPIDVRMAPGWSLRSYQQEANDKFVADQRGYIEAPTGSGKTIMGCGLIARLGVVTLVVGHTTEILDTWAKEIRGDPARGSVAKLTGGFAMTRLQGRKGSVEAARGDIILATVQTLHRLPEETWGILGARVGLVVGDEAHHSPAMTFWHVFNRCPARLRLGLTATPKRKDQLDFLLLQVMGPAVVRINEEMLMAVGAIMRPHVEFIATNFYPAVPQKDQHGNVTQNVVAAREIADSSYNRTLFIQHLTESEERNTLIARRVEADWKKGHVCAVLTERVGHAQRMADLFRSLGMVAELHVGKVAKEQRRNIVAGVISGRVDVIVGTSVLDEGIDIPNLSALHLTCPSNNEGRLIQQIGRIRRPKDGGIFPEVRDYVDVRCKAVIGSYHNRRKWYRRKNFIVVDFKALPAIMGV